MKMLEVQGHRIKAAQLAANISDSEISDLLGLKTAYYRRKINGKQAWTLKDLEVIQAATGKTFNYFYGLSDY